MKTNGSNAKLYSIETKTSSQCFDRRVIAVPVRNGKSKIEHDNLLVACASRWRKESMFLSH
eukprot:5155029-Pleurochrysis_carterae.AAC.3